MRMLSVTFWGVARRGLSDLVMITPRQIYNRLRLIYSPAGVWAALPHSVASWNAIRRLRRFTQITQIHTDFKRGRYSGAVL